MRKRVSAVLLALALGAIFIFPAPASAQLTLWTEYPSVTVNAGDRVTFPLRIDNTFAADQTVALELVDVPEGWEATLRGGGRLVNAVFVEGGETGDADLQVDIPASATTGDYAITVRASGQGGVSELDLTVRIAEGATGASGLEAEFPVLQGAAGSSFDFRLTLSNDTPERQLFALSAEVPEGWQVSFRPTAGSQQVTTIPVDGGSSERIDVNIDTPDRVEAGEYRIPVRAQASGATVETELQVVITGSYELRVAPADERFSFRATAGRATEVPLLVFNDGTAPLENVSLSASTPSDWTVEFEPESIDQIPPGEFREVTARVTPKAQAIAGDYMVTLSGSARQASTDRAEFRVSVTTPTLWGWLGLALVVAAVAGTFGVFRVYGRR
ncbi:MAG TPA: NEW3 domain-containing protein [Bacillota bacterium]